MMMRVYSSLSPLCFERLRRHVVSAYCAAAADQLAPAASLPARRVRELERERAGDASLAPAGRLDQIVELDREHVRAKLVEIGELDEHLAEEVVVAHHVVVVDHRVQQAVARAEWHL